MGYYLVIFQYRGGAVFVAKFAFPCLQLLTRILNRDSSLLPAYFAADAVSPPLPTQPLSIPPPPQIQRHYQPLKEKGGPSQPHWVLEPAVRGLQEAMGTLADLVSGSGNASI